MLAETNLATAAVEHLWSNWDDVLFGATMLGIVAHAVQSFPAPKNAYGAWLLGVIQFAVGQRMRGQNTMAQQNTVSIPTTQPEGKPTFEK